MRIRCRAAQANELRPRLLVELELDGDDDVDEQLANAKAALEPVRQFAVHTLDLLVEGDLIRGYRLWDA